jgi:hypothetical protein
MLMAPPRKMPRAVTSELVGPRPSLARAVRNTLAKRNGKSKRTTRTSRERHPVGAVRINALEVENYEFRGKS